MKTDIWETLTHANQIRETMTEAIITLKKDNASMEAKEYARANIDIAWEALGLDWETSDLEALIHADEIRKTMEGAVITLREDNASTEAKELAQANIDITWEALSLSNKLGK